MRSEFTSNSTTVKLAYIMYNTAGNTADTWLDVNDMLLEEIVEPVANTLSSASASIVSLTAVGAYDTDQSQLVNTSSLSFSTAAQYQAQQFTPTKSKLAGLTFMKKPNV